MGKRSKLQTNEETIIKKKNKLVKSETELEGVKQAKCKHMQEDSVLNEIVPPLKNNKKHKENGQISEPVACLNASETERVTSKHVMRRIKPKKLLGEDSAVDILEPSRKKKIKRKKLKTEQSSEILASTTPQLEVKSEHITMVGLKPKKLKDKALKLDEVAQPHENKKKDKKRPKTIVNNSAPVTTEISRDHITQETNCENPLDDDSKLDELVPQLEKRNKQNKFRSKQSFETIVSTKPNKKILFTDDHDAIEVPVTSGSNNDTRKNKLNPDEAEVKDEDIDKFCDEIDDEDNKQYEDWVKLIEAKLHSNKKSK